MENFFNAFKRYLEESQNNSTLNDNLTIYNNIVHEKDSNDEEEEDKMEEIFKLRKSKKYQYLQPMDSLDVFMNLSLTLTLSSKNSFCSLNNEEFKTKFEGEENKQNKFIYKYGNSPIIHQEAYIQLRKDRIGNEINFNFYLPYINQDILNFIMFKYDIEEYSIFEETRILPLFNPKETY